MNTYKNKDIMKLTQMVLDFHNAMSVPVVDKPAVPAYKRCELRHKLMQEEVNELHDAMMMGDLTKVADGIADLLYVTIGTAIEFGLHPCLGDILAEVHRSNMSKLDAVTGKPIHREDGKVLKPPTFSAPNLAPIIQKAQSV